MKKTISFLGLFALIAALVLPSTVLASPISGADLDVSSYVVNSFGNIEDTTDANSVDADDVEWPMTGGSELYFGGASKFSRIYFYVSAENVSSSWIIAEAGNFGSLQYYNGSDWADLTVTNSTGMFNGTGIHYLSFSAPADWATTSLGEGLGTHYYIKVPNCDTGCNQMMATFDIDQISLLSSGGGTPTPEFSTYVLLITLCLAGIAVVKQTQSVGIARA